MKQQFGFVSCYVAAALLAACGTSAVATDPSIPEQTQAQHHGATFAYVTNAASRTIYAYEVNTATGALTAVRRSPFSTREFPWGVAIARDRFLYVANGVGTNEYSTRHSHVTGYTLNRMLACRSGCRRRRLQIRVAALPIWR